MSEFYSDLWFAAKWVIAGFIVWATVGFGWLAMICFGSGIFVILIAIMEALLWKKQIKELENNRYW